MKSVETAADSLRQLCSGLLSRVEELAEEVEQARNQVGDREVKAQMLEQQLHRLKLEETQQHHRDQSATQELQEAQLALF